MINKLFSKKGQVSMEIGILVVSAITVAVVSSYYYMLGIIESHPEKAGETANKTSSILGNKSIKYANSISDI
jgi:uncharacterized protein (UPF0333 family)